MRKLVIICAAGIFISLLVVLPFMVGCAAPAPTLTPAPAPEPAPASGAGTEHQVTIKNFAFSPAEITIKVEDTVTWIEQDTVHHTTTGGIFDSGDLGQGQTYSKTFDKAGTYDYTCNYHPNMKGKVIVIE